MHPTAFLDLALRTLQDGGNSVPAAWSAYSRPAAALALTAIWQGAAVALGLALCLRLAPRSPARHRFALWAGGFGVLVALQVLPLISRLVPVHLAGAGGSVAAIGAAAASHPWIQLSAGWSLVIVALWLAASLYRAADLALHSLHLRKLWKTAVPVEIDPASLPRSLGRLSRPAVQICTTGELERPSVIGFFAPRILIPDWLFPRLTPGELDQILLHETEHLRRRDDWTNLLQKLCLVLFPLNPGLAWMERRLCREREMACDDGVIRITRAPRAYAACLASLAERGLERRAGMLSLGAWQARPELVRRVHSILRHKHVLSPLAARTVLGALGCVLAAGAMALAHCPRLVAFEPAEGSASAAQMGSAEQPGALKAQDAAHKEFAAIQGREFLQEKHEVLKDPESHAPKSSRRRSESSATEESASRASMQGNPHQPASPAAAAATATPQDKGSARQLASVAAEHAGLHPGRAGAGPASRADSAFIVMSTWKSFEVTDPEGCQMAAANKAAGCIESIRVAGPANALAAQRITPRITVTRMYLKIYSAGDKGSTWLVFQL